MSDPQGDNDRRVTLQKIYVRDASVEVPAAPQVFTGEWRPSIDVDLNMRVSDLGEQAHHVSVTATVTARQGDTIAYIVEVEQAGIFQVTGFDDGETLRQVLGVYCPGVLFPYLRETIGDLVQRAGFPHFLLQPVNFDALYQRHRESRAQPEADARTLRH